MGSSIAVSGPLLGIAFVAGIVVGWMLANVTRTKETIQLAALPPGADPSTDARRVAKTKVRTMELKCKCGSVLKFRDPVEPGYQPYPAATPLPAQVAERLLTLERSATWKRVRRLVERDSPL